jgi:hypothetical protein
MNLPPGPPISFPSGMATVMLWSFDMDRCVPGMLRVSCGLAMSLCRQFGWDQEQAGEGPHWKGGLSCLHMLAALVGQVAQQLRKLRVHSH